MKVRKFSVDPNSIDEQVVQAALDEGMGLTEFCKPYGYSTEKMIALFSKLFSDDVVHAFLFAFGKNEDKAIRDEARKKIFEKAQAKTPAGAGDSMDTVMGVCPCCGRPGLKRGALFMPFDGPDHILVPEGAVADKEGVSAELRTAITTEVIALRDKEMLFNASLREEFSSEDIVIAHTRTIISENEAKILALSSRIGKINVELGRMSVERTDLSNKIERGNEKILRLEVNGISDCKRKVERAQEKLDEVGGNGRARTAAEQKLANAQAELDKAYCDLDEAKVKLTKRTSELDLLDQKIEALKAERIRLEDELESLRKETKRLSDELAEISKPHFYVRRVGDVTLLGWRNYDLPNAKIDDKTKRELGTSVRWSDRLSRYIIEEGKSLSRSAFAAALKLISFSSRLKENYTVEFGDGTDDVREAYEYFRVR